MNKFKRGSAAVLAGLMLWMVSGTSFGMGLGRPVSRAILGDTLTVSVPVRLEPGEDLSPECIKADVYFGDDKLPSAAIQTQLKTSPAPVGRTPEAVIQIRTTTLINEPVVTVYVVAGCQTRLTRKLVTLVDPPDLNEPVVSSSQGHAPTKSDAERVAATPLPALDGVQVVHDPVSQSSKLGGKVPSLSLSGRASAKQNTTPKRAKDPAKTTSGRAVAQGARLVVDPVATDAVVNPELQMTSGMTVPAQDDAASSPELMQRRRSAAAIWHAMNASPEELARDRERLEQVESKLDALSRDSAKASEVVTGLQSRLAQQANGDGLVYVLGTLIVVLLGFIGWREWAMRRALSEQAAWLTSQVPDDTAPPASELGDTASLLPEIQNVVAEVDAELEAQAMPVAATSYPDLATAPRFDVLAQFAEQPPAKTAPAPVARQDHLRDVSVDELIDLEQQAEFFLVLGQDESAIDVLEGYIRGTTSASPMPFLKLLEIYRRLGMRTDYERTRMNFNLRFNAHAPLWDADLTHGHELKDYPGVIERLQALWADPARALEVLERSLMRQDAESYTFDLPAYRELLFLYAVLRDLSERPDGGHAGVDLLISSPASKQGDLEPLMATLPMKALPDLAPTLSLDLELDDLFVDLPVKHPVNPPADHKP